MTRLERIEDKIRSLRAQLAYWQTERERAKVSEEKDALIFQDVPEKVRCIFEDMHELRRFVLGQHDGKGLPGVTPEAYAQATTVYERLSTIKGIGDNDLKETIQVLGIETKDAQ